MRQEILRTAVRLAEQIAKTERDAGMVVISDGGNASLASDLSSQSGTRISSLRSCRQARRQRRHRRDELAFG